MRPVLNFLWDWVASAEGSWEGRICGAALHWWEVVAAALAIVPPLVPPWHSARPAGLSDSFLTSPVGKQPSVKPFTDKNCSLVFKLISFSRY